MIDVNLLGKIPKAKPEKAPRTGPLVRPKLIVITGILAVSAVAYLYYQDIMDLFSSDEEPMSTVTQSQPEAVPIDTPQTTVETEPPAETEPAPSVPFDYNLSMEHINVFTLLVRSIPVNTGYNLISVRGSDIIAEITTANDENMFTIQTAITEALDRYIFDAEPKGRMLQLWGALKSEAVLPEANPSSTLTAPEDILNTINASMKEYNITLQNRGETDPTDRDLVSILPVWIKLKGSEKNILDFLADIKTKNIPINITKISGESRNRGQSNAATILNVHFEIIM